MYVRAYPLFIEEKSKPWGKKAVTCSAGQSELHKQSK